MRDIKYIGSTSYTDNFFGSGKTWAYAGQIHEVPDLVADRLLTNPLFVEVEADVVLAVSNSGNVSLTGFRGASKPDVPISSTAPAIGQVLTWDGDEYANATPRVRPFFGTQEADVPESPLVIGETYADLPGAQVTLDVPAGALLQVHVQATMVTDAGTVKIALFDGTNTIDLLASTATTAETRVAAAGSTTGVVQTGAAGGLLVIPVSAAGTVTYSLQAKHEGATTPGVSGAVLRVICIGY